MIVVVFGVIFFGYGVVYSFFKLVMLVYLFIEGIFFGIWFLLVFFVGFIVCKFGVVLFFEVLVVIVEVVFGGLWGVGIFIFGVV